MMDPPAKPAEGTTVEKAQPAEPKAQTKDRDPATETASPSGEPATETEVKPEAATEAPPETKPTAADDTDEATLELARRAQNPISSLISVPIQFNSNFGVGPNDSTTYTVNIQPVVPVALNENLTLVNRAIIPISFVPNSVFPPGLANGAELGLGDINYQMFFVPATEPGELIWGVGPTFTFPTATEDRMGTGKWLAGANAVALMIKGRWVTGALVNQQWSVAGNSARPDVSFMTLQPFVTRNFDKGWFVSSSPILSSNWNAESGEQWTVPVGGGFGRIFPIGDQQVNVSLQGFGNVVKPSNGPDWSLRFTFTLLFP
jgi:hypothetical protein